MIDAVAREHPGERVELWFMDEARVGQKGGVTHVWYQKGVRPRGVRQQGFSSAYLFGAVCPERGEGVALVLPEVSTAAMGVFLAELARAVPAGTHAALVLDGAGWHVSDDLTVPANLTLIHPPPYSPELNPVERVWEYLRDRWLSHRVLAGGHEAVVDAACAAWNALLAEPGRLRSLQAITKEPDDQKKLTMYADFLQQFSVQSGGRGLCELATCAVLSRRRRFAEGARLWRQSAGQRARATSIFSSPRRALPSR